MSIKSQKSLNEECSEIFERSYSVRSASDESLSCEDEDEALSRQLMHKMTPRVLAMLKRCFKKNNERARSIDVDKRVEEVMRAAAAEEGIEFAPCVPPPTDTLWLDENGFVTSINNIFGKRKYMTHAQKLFRMLDRFACGKVWWGQLVARLVAAGATRLASRVDTWEPIPDPSVKRLQHCKREVIVKLVNIEREDSFCYVAVTKGGRVGIYDGELQLLNTYEIFYQRTGVRRRVKNYWITDAIYLSDVKYLLVCASDRSLTIYDVTTLSHTPLYCITSLPNIPTCATYRAAARAAASSELALGDAHGDILRLTFTHPRLQFLHSTAPDCINNYYWMELFSPPHSSHVTITKCRHVHSRAITRLAYARDGDVLVSCSHDNTVSVRIKHVPGKIDDYTFKVPRGVSCFAWVEGPRVLALCSAAAVLVWSAGSRRSVPLAPQRGAARPLDVVSLPHSRLLLVYYDNCTINIWDLDEECLLQTLKVKFPFLGVLGKKVEFGTYSIFPGPPRKKLQRVFEDREMASRRGSSVFQGSSGGLMLLPDAEEDYPTRDEIESEYERFNRSEILVTCCDYVCVLSMREKDGEVLPPPGDTLQPRRPSLWDLNEESLSSECCVSSRASRPPPSPRVSEGAAPEHSARELDNLLENAGLQGILEKDFVLMQGLKHDLNRKMAALEVNKESMMSAVNAGAPYLALRTYEPDSIVSVDQMTEEYERVMSRTTGTPSASTSSTPRYTRRTKL